ncbi:MAG: hypothetical protein WCB51_07005 [Candidatus Dormiibacterota bacterium]
MSERRRGLLIIAAVAGSYVVLSILLTLPAWTAPSTTYIGEGPDPLQAIWAMGWVPFAVGHGLDPLVSYSMNSPTGFDLLWTQPSAIPVAVLWPVTALFGPVVTYNVVMTLSLALASCFAFLVIRRWVSGVVAAAIGGLVYGFSPYMTGQLLGHVNLVLAGVTPPLALMLLDEIVVRQRLRPRTLGVLTALLAIVQFFIAQEVLLTEIIAAAVVTAVLAVTHRSEVRARSHYVVQSLTYAVVPAVVVLAYPVWLQFFGVDHVVNSGAIHGTDVYVTDPANFVVPTVAQLISPPVATAVSSHFTGNASEWDAYLGIPLILLLIVATVRFWRVPLVRTVAIVAVVFAVFSLGPHLNVQRHPLLVLPLPWWIPAHLPLLDDILPNRLMVYVDLAAAILVAFMLRALWLLKSRPALNVAVAVVALFPLIPTLPAQTTRLTVPPPFTSAHTASMFQGANVLFEPFPSEDYPDAMIWQMSAGYSFSIVGGYTVGEPSKAAQDLQRRIYDLTAASSVMHLTAEDRSALAADLCALSFAVVVVGSGATPGMESLFTQLLGAPPDRVDGLLVWKFLPFHCPARRDSDP